MKAKVDTLQVDAVKERMDRGEKVIFVDISTPESWEVVDAQIPGTRHVPMENLPAQAGDFPSDATLITYSASPRDESSRHAARVLLQLGYSDVHALEGGLEAWTRAGLPTERKHDTFPTH